MTIFSKGSQFLFNAARTVRRAPFPKRLPTSGPRSVHRRSLTARSYHVQVSDIQAEAGFVIGKEAREAAEQTGKTLWGTGLGGTIEDAVDCLEEAARLTKGREKYSDQLTDADKRGMLTYMNMIYDGFDVEAILRQPNNVFVTQRAKAVDNLWVQATQTHAGNKKPVTVVLTPSFGPVLEQNRAHGATVIEFNIHNYDTPEDAVIAMLEFSEQHKDSLSINCIWNPMNPTGFQYGEKIVDMVADGIYRKLFHSLLDESGIYIPGQQQILSPVVKSGALIYGSETKCMLVNSGSKFPLGMALGAGFSVTNWPDFGKVVSMDHSKPNPFIASLYKVGGPMAEARLDRATDYIDAADQLCHELGLLGVATTGSEFPQYQRVAAMSLMYVDRGPLGERGVTIDQVRHVLMHDLEHDIVPVIPHHMLIARGSTNEQRQYARLANTDLYPDQIGQLVEAMSPALTDMRLYDKFHTRQNYNMSPGLGGLAYLKPDSASKQVRKFSTVARPSNDTSTFATVWGLGSVGAALAKLAFDTENKPPKVVSKATHITEVEYTEVDGTESVFPVQVVHPDQVASGEALTGLYTLYAGSGDGFSSILPSLHSQRPSNILAFLNGILPDPPTGVELLDARPQPLRVGVSPDFPIRVPQALVFAGFNASRPSGTGHTLRAGAVFHNGIVLPEVAQPFVDAVADDLAGRTARARFSARARCVPAARLFVDRAAGRAGRCRCPAE